MTTYNELCDALTGILEESDGTDPETGVTALYSPEIYAAYAWLVSVNPAEFSEWRTEAEDAYEGTFDTSRDFAQHVAEEIGAVPTDGSWPLYCIDWEWAARELMYDYMEHAGHYFRNA